MTDTTEPTATITRLISTGTTEQVLLITVAHPFPELSASELSQAIQWATAAAERKVLRGGREEVLT